VGAVLGLVQGATEFLPVSSSGHLVLARHLLGVATPGAAWEAWLHVGTLGAVALAYRRELVRLAQGIATGGRERAFAAALAWGTLPAAAAGLTLRRPLEALYASPLPAAWGLVATACVLLSLPFCPPGRDRTEGEGALAALPPGRALLVGCAQALALLPGLSRSGATIAAARWLGLPAEQATTFSFLLSVPAVVGAAALELGGHGAALALSPAAAAGAAAAFLSGYAALALTRRLVPRGRLALFAPYALLVALTALVRP
jgi:undecaprenyl-diphosphatase